MDALVWEYDELVLRVDGGVFELFRVRHVENSFRLPLTWIGARAEPRRGDRIRVYFGAVTQRHQPVYGSNLTDLTPTGPTVTLPTAQEPGLRGFLTELARRAGRPLSA